MLDLIYKIKQACYTLKYLSLYSKLLRRGKAD